MKLRSQPHHRMLRILAPLLLFVFGCFTPAPPPPSAVSPSEAGVAILGDVQRLAPGSQASFLVQAREPYGWVRRPDVPVEVYLNGPEGDSRLVYQGTTGADGIAPVRFAVPADLSAPEQVLEVRTAPSYGYDTSATGAEATGDPLLGADAYRAFQDVYVGRTYNVLLTTDKPVYQPGQVIHLRGLALDTLDMRAADGITMTLTVADPQGNKLLRKEIPTSAYGIVSADFPLAAEAVSGDYAITAEMGPAASTRTVEVKPYTLPRFEITFAPDRPFYLPGDIATGSVEARYFFGKPVTGGQVTIRGTLDDGSGAQTVVEVSGVTDEDGRYVYTFLVPEELAGRLDNKSVDVNLDISVVDAAGHAENTEESVTVAEKLLLIEAVPEAGTLRRGLDDRVYLSVQYPDGVAAQAQVTVTDFLSQTYTGETDGYGQAVITLTTPHEGLTPLLVTATAMDGTAAGASVEQPLLLAAEEETSTAAVLLRPARAEYHVGETLDVDIFVADLAQGQAGPGGSASPIDTVYLDIIKDRQSFAVAPLPLSDGAARAAIALDGSLLGTLELNAYVVDGQGQIARDRRYILVNPAPAEVAVTADKTEYRPGETATLDIAVTRAGEPLQAAVGVAIVDESVYAVDGGDAPGFARTYFLLNRELQETRYGLHDFVDLEGGDPSPYDGAPESVRYAQGPAQELGAGAAAEEARQLALAGALATVLADEAETASAVAGPQTTGPSAPAVGSVGGPAMDPWVLAGAWGNRLYLLAPLVGLALYDGTRSRRRLLIGLVVFSLGAFVWGACGSPGAVPAGEFQGAPDEQAAGSTTATRGEKPPRLRQFFPETMYWLPEVVTDEAGRAQIEAPMADTITTWRATLLVSDKAGNLGSAELPLRAFQDFFVEPDLPRFLVVGDEIDVPVAVYNYLAEPQSITLDVAPGDWFELRGEPQLALAAGANEVMAAYVPIRVTQSGAHELQITAIGSRQSDAVVKDVTVVPRGRRMMEARGGRLDANGATEIGLPVAAEAIAGTGQVTVKIYGGPVSQMLGGLEGMLAMPYGCFEQTSSVTYPNVLVLDYLRRTGQATPSVEMQAEYLIGLGYQRLISFETPGEPGGFSLFGDPPADRGLTAYGLLEFGDMARVAYVDPALLERMVTYLRAEQNRDGSWEPNLSWLASPGDEESAEAKAEARRMETEARLATTAYIAWGMADAGYGDDRAVRSALRFITRTLDRLADSRETEQPLPLSNYTLGLAANALVAGGGNADGAIEELVRRVVWHGARAHWPANAETYFGGYGLAGDVEVTGIAAQALLRSAPKPEAVLETAQGALNYLMSQRDPYGSFYTTQATVQALKALLLGADGADPREGARVTVRLARADGTVETQAVTIEPGSDVVQTVMFAGAEPRAALTLELEGNRALEYQVVSEYYVPWGAQEVGAAGATATAAERGTEPLQLTVGYDRNELRMNELLGVTAQVQLPAGEQAETLIVELGLPPGFTPVTADLDALVDDEEVERYELTGRSIVFYLTSVAGGEPRTFVYRLLAHYPVTVQGVDSSAYDYYAPHIRANAPPQPVIVTRTP